MPQSPGLGRGQLCTLARVGVECCHDDISLHRTVGDAFANHGVIGKNICSQKIFVSPEVLTPEMVLTSKWGRIQPEILI